MAKSFIAYMVSLNDLIDFEMVTISENLIYDEGLDFEIGFSSRQIWFPDIKPITPPEYMQIVEAIFVQVNGAYSDACNSRFEIALAKLTIAKRAVNDLIYKISERMLAETNSNM